VRALLALLIVAGGLAGVVTAGALQELSNDVRGRLAAGEVVVHDTLPPGASETARGGTARALVRASPEQVWQILIDYPGHARYYPRVVSAEVVERGARNVIVRYRVGIGPFSFAFHMDKYPDPARRRIEWHLAEGHGTGLFRENSGYWQVDEAAGASLVTYAIGVRTVLPAAFTGRSERDSLSETVLSLRRLAEEEAGAARRPR
jgi:ribosome-associated toxin RatA of RatAB toxin-antitoxin module